jgi:transposase, IS30 family
MGGLHYGSYESRSRIKNAVSIEKCPAIVDSKSRIGDWEDDTVIGKDHKSAIYILVDRKSLYTVIVKLNGKNATELVDKAFKVLEPMSNLYHCLR